MTRLPHSRKLFLFAGLNVADLALTWLLLERCGDRAHECNPVASWWLAGFGWSGLAAYKLAVVALVAAVTVIVSRHRPRAGGRVVAFGCCALLAVVLYSGLLVSADAAELGGPAADVMGQAQERSDRLDRKAAQVRDYGALLRRLRDDLIARRSTLDEATETLAGSDHAQDPQWRRTAARRFPDRSVREFLAARLMEEVLGSPEADRDGWEELARELEAQYRSCYGRPPPHLRTWPRTSSTGGRRSPGKNYKTLAARLFRA